MPFRPNFPNASAIASKVRTPVFTVVVDAEEDFDWIRPTPGIEHSVSNMRNLTTFRALCAAYKVVPTYLLTYPVLVEPDITVSLRRSHEAGECDLGVQLHSWVTPPFDPSVEREPHSTSSSYAGNLPPELEEQKILAMKARFEDCFGASPRIYRAGRYGLSTATPAILERLGFDIDTSVAPRTDFHSGGGPDYSDFAYKCFTFGEKRRLLEIPLCREIVGVFGDYGKHLHHLGSSPLGGRLKVNFFASIARLAERVTLSPEGNDLQAMKRLVRGLANRGELSYIVSFHSSSLRVGVNPYVSTYRDYRSFYDRLSGILNFLAVDCGAQPRSLVQISQQLSGVC